jgi:hypothetical protein
VVLLRGGESVLELRGDAVQAVLLALGVIWLVMLSILTVDNREEIELMLLARCGYGRDSGEINGKSEGTNEGCSCQVEIPSGNPRCSTFFCCGFANKSVGWILVTKSLHYKDDPFAPVKYLFPSLYQVVILDM